MAELILGALVVWGALGALVAVPFLTVGLARAVPEAKGTGPLTRLMLLPGCVALWPVVAWRFLRRMGEV